MKSRKNLRKNKLTNNKTKKQFLYNPNNPKKSFDVYIDKNPNDTIHIKYTTLDDVRNTINLLEKLYKISTKWGIEISLGRGEYILFKNKTIQNDSKLLCIDLESLTDIKFEEFHPYAQGTPARIQMLGTAAFFFYGAFLGNALRV
jgi:hypothetical protein